MASHVKALGILHIVFGVLGILMGLFFLLFMGGLAAFIGMTDDGEGAFLAVPVLGGIGGIAFLFALILSLPSVIAGIGLLRFRPWACSFSPEPDERTLWDRTGNLRVVGASLEPDGASFRQNSPGASNSRLKLCSGTA